jgi:hypothetical protein
MNTKSTNSKNSLPNNIKLSSLIPVQPTKVVFYQIKEIQIEYLSQNNKLVNKLPMKICQKNNYVNNIINNIVSKRKRIIETSNINK